MGFKDTAAKALGLATLADNPPADLGPVGDYSVDVSPPARSTSPSVSVDRAVTLPSVFRAIQMISTIGAGLELHSWRGNVKVDPAPALITKPDPWRSARSFKVRWLVNAASDGNNFVLKHRGADGTVNTGGVELLNPFTTYVRWEVKNGRRVKLYDGVDPRTAKLRTFTEDEVDHVWCGLEVPGHDRALGPIEACRLSLSGILETRDYGSGWFGEQAQDQASGILSTDQRLDPAAAAHYRKVWQNPQGLDAEDKPLPRSSAGPSVRVLGQGMAYTPIMLKPADAQWLEAQGFGVLDVARMFGLPGDYLLAAVEGSTLTYTTLLMVDTQFTRNTLAPVYLDPLEDALTELLPRGQRALTDYAKFLEADAKTRADVDETYIAAGVYGPEYVQERDHIENPRPAPANERPAKRPAGVPA